jgi:hypothetical protein
MVGVCQLLSVACLAGFVGLSKVAAIGSAKLWGLLAVALMALSSVLSFALAALAPSASLDTVSTLRTVNFIAGGTAHVVTLGLFVLLASRITGFGRGLRVLACVAAVPSVVSLISLFVFEGAALILLGRLLCMVWVLAAAVNATVRISRGRLSEKLRDATHHLARRGVIAGSETSAGRPRRSTADRLPAGRSDQLARVSSAHLAQT